MAAHTAPHYATAVDQGLAPATDVKDVFIGLKLPDRAGLEAFIASTVERGNANFGKFVTPAEFKTRFGQPDAAVARVTAFLASRGLQVTNVYGNNLVISVRGTNAQLSSLFGTTIHTYSANGQTFQRPATRQVIPAEVSDVVAGVAGLSTQWVKTSFVRAVDPAGVPPAITLANRIRPAATPPASGIPQQYTVNDFASMYDVTPLQKRGLTGAGVTLGIMTFASFKASDISTYWGAVGISSSTDRMTTVNVIPGSKISSSGAVETTIDLEQSGGLAPGANIIVYEAPNSDAGELALYTKAVTDNIADTLSISWGQPEVTIDQQALLDPLFMQSAAQGVPITAASADSGAYDLNNAQVFPYPSYSDTLSVDFPAASPYILAAGGTTLPGTTKLSHGSVTVPAVRPWGWDYLFDYITTNDGQAYYYANVFPVGGGGGVSVVYPLPSYQAGLAGTLTSAPGQSLICFSSPAAGQPCTPGDDLIDMPAGYAGRNVPDVSMDADPETGYSLYFQRAWTTGYGGTSFVAPQLNGVMALITQQKGARLGWIQPQIYPAFKTQGYGSGSPFRPVSSGDNLFFVATPSYNPATGLGQLDIDNLSKVLAP